jgi:peptidoglycan/LPS O-acetylase OafA/YrhL
MIYTVGIKTFSQLRSHQVGFGGSCMVTLITCLAVIVPLAELFYRCVEIPSKVGAHKFYDFITA